MNQSYTEHSTQQQQNTSSYQAHLNTSLSKLDHILGNNANIKWFKEMGLSQGSFLRKMKWKMISIT